MFADCPNLVGGNGTTYDEAHTDVEYAHVDLPGQPGYLTGKNNIGTGIDANLAGTGIRVECQGRTITVTGAEGASCQIYDLGGRELVGQSQLGRQAKFHLNATDVCLVYIRPKNGQPKVYKILVQ